MRIHRNVPTFAAFFAIALLIATVLPLPDARAQDDASSGAIISHETAAEAYWTPARFANAKPMPMPRGTIFPLGHEPSIEPPGSLLYLPGKPPTTSAAPNAIQLFTPVSQASDQLSVPQALGSAGLRFTSSRLVADAVADIGGEKKYPYSMEGQIFFTVPPGTPEPAGDYICSGTVQTIGIVTTAGHCIADGNGHFFTNWRFVPALRSGKAPFGSWTPSIVYTTPTWFTGGGAVPNAQDVAVLVLKLDRSRRRVGNYTGWAGFSIPDLYSGQHVTALGYPSNIDNATKDHRTDAQVVGGGNNTDVIGNDAGPGSSGGGWFVNFGEIGSGQPVSGVFESIPNALVAVTSYGPTTPGILYQGASILDTRYVQCVPLNTCSAAPTALLNYACVKNPGAC